MQVSWGELFYYFSDRATFKVFVCFVILIRGSSHKKKREIPITLYKGIPTEKWIRTQEWVEKSI